MYTGFLCQVVNIVVLLVKKSYINTILCFYFFYYFTCEKNIIIHKITFLYKEEFDTTNLAAFLNCYFDYFYLRLYVCMLVYIYIYIYICYDNDNI